MSRSWNTTHWDALARPGKPQVLLRVLVGVAAARLCSEAPRAGVPHGPPGGGHHHCGACATQPARAQRLAACVLRVGVRGGGLWLDSPNSMWKVCCPHCPSTGHLGPAHAAQPKHGCISNGGNNCTLMLSRCMASTLHDMAAGQHEHSFRHTIGFAHVVAQKLCLEALTCVVASMMRSCLLDWPPCPSPGCAHRSRAKCSPSPPGACCQSVGEAATLGRAARSLRGDSCAK
jgi:hypothetical protein